MLPDAPHQPVTQLGFAHSRATSQTGSDGIFGPQTTACTAQRREEDLEGENGSPWKDRTYPARQRDGTLRTRPRRKALKLAAPIELNAERPDAQAPGWEAPSSGCGPARC